MNSPKSTNIYWFVKLTGVLRLFNNLVANNVKGWEAILKWTPQGRE